MTKMVVDDLGTLVAFPTVSNRPLLALASWLAQRFEDLGFTIERFQDPDEAGKCSLICTIGPPSVDGLVLSGHMDVVPTEGQPWTSDPFVLTEREGRLYGRGSADMKGFFACTLAALARIPASAYQRELTLIWTHDEEVGCLGSAKLVRAWDADSRPLPRACLIGEPTDFQILRMHPGHVGLEIALTGAAAHSSRPDLGCNAVEAAAEVVAETRALAAELAGELTDLPELERPWVAVNVANIHGGSAINIVPDRCVVQVGYRPLPGTDPEAVFRRLRDRVMGLNLAAKVEARLLRVTPSMLTESGTPLQHLLAHHALHDAVGAASFATDGANLAQIGCAPLVFGPGRIEVAHQADEYVPVEQLHQAVGMIEDVVRKRCC
jgi:acetylornithine deacetylase